jgi:TRAP-type uncharacterized transport system substrate-binding protein
MVAAHHRTNRLQIVLYILGTFILAGAAAVAISYYFLRPKVLRVAVGPVGGVYQRVVEKLGPLVQSDSRNLRLLPVFTDNDADSLAKLHRGAVDLAIARTDAKIPADARVVALLERELMYIVTAKSRKFTALSGLKGLKVAILASDGQNEAFIKRLLASVDVPSSSYTSQSVPFETPFERLLLAPPTPAYQAAILLSPASRFGGQAQREQMGRRIAQLEFHGIEGGKAIEKQVPGVFSETIDAGTFSASPAVPDDELESVGLHHLMLARKQMPSGVAAALTRIIVENKDELGLEHEFAALIEPPDEEKTAQFLAHPGSADYVNGEVKTFLERYSDLFYIGTAAAGLIGSLFVALYSWITRVDPVRASSLTGEVLAIADRIKKCRTMEDIDIAETELEDILKRALTGLQDETISPEGLDVFRLSHDDAHRSLMARRNAIIGALPSRREPTEA